MATVAEMKMWRQQVAELTQAAQQQTEPSARAAKLLEVGDLYRDRLEAPVLASECYYQAVSACKGSPTAALKRLARLARETGDVAVTANLVAALAEAGHWRDVCTVLGRQAEAAQGEERLGLFLEAARVAGSHLDDQAEAARLLVEAAKCADLKTLPEAITRLGEYLDLHPEALAVARALSSLECSAGRFEEALRALEGSLKYATGEEGVAAHLEAAALCQDKLAAPAPALAHLQRAAALSIDHPGLQEAVLALWRRAPELGEPLADLLVAVGEAQLKAEWLLGALARAPKGAKAALHRRLGELAEAHLHDPAMAFTHYREALEEGEAAEVLAAALRRVAPAVPGAIPSLHELFRRKLMWDALVGALDDEAALTVEDEVRAELLFKAGEILEGRLGDQEGAMRRFVQAFKLCPRELRYVEAGERLYRRRGQWDMVERLLSIRARLELEPSRRVERRLELLALVGRRGDVPALLALLEQLFEELAAVRAPDALKVRLDAWIATWLADRAQASALEAGILASAPELRRARLKRFIPLFQVFGAGASAALLEAALALEPGDEAAFAALARLKAGALEEAEWLASAVARPLTPLVQAAALERAAELYLNEGHPERAVALLRQAVLKLGARALMAPWLATAEAVGPECLSEALGELCALPSLDVEHRQRFLRRLALLLLDQGDADGAALAFERLHALLPGDAEAQRFLRAHYRARRAYGPLVALLKAAVLDSVAARLAQAELLAEAGELRLAASALSEVDPADRAAVRPRLMALYTTLGDHGALARLQLEALAEGSVDERLALARAVLAGPMAPEVEAAALAVVLGVTVPTAEAAPVERWMRWLELPRAPKDQAEALALAAERLPDQRLPLLIRRAKELASVEAWREVLALAPGHLEAVEEAAGLLEAEGRHREVVDLLLQAAVDASPKVARGWLRRAIAWLSGALGARHEALAHLPRLIELGADDWAEGLRLTLLAEEGDWAAFCQEAARRTERLLAEGRVAEAAEVTRLRARALSKELDSPAEALAAWLHVLDQHPEDEEALSAVAAGLEAEGRLAEAERVLERWAGVSRGVTQRGACLLRLAELRAQGGDLSAAMDVYERLRRLRPDDRGPVAALKRLALQAGDTARAARALAAELPLIADSAESLAANRQLALLQTELEAYPAAVLAWERVLASEPSHQEAQEALVPLLKALGRGDALVGLHRARLGSTADEGKRLEILNELAALHEARGEHAAALECWFSLFRVRSDEQSLEALARLAEASGQWSRLQEALDLHRRRLGGPQPELLLRQAALAEERLSDLGAALAYVRAAFDADPSLGPIFDELRRLAEARGDSEILLWAWRRRAQSTAGDEQVDALVKAARVAERRLEQPERAFELLAEAYRAAPARQTELMGELVRLALTYERLDDLVQFAQIEGALSPGREAALLGEAAALFALRPQGARPALHFALLALSRAPEQRAHAERVLELAKATDQGEPAFAAVERLAETAEAPLFCWLLLALLKPAAPEALKLASQALAHSPTEPWCAEVLLEVGAAGGKAASLEVAASLEREAGWLRTAVERARLLSAAALAAKQAQAGGEAARLALKAADARPEPDKIEQALSALKAAEDAVGLAKALARFAEVGTDEVRSQRFEALAELLAPDDPAGAIQAWRRALSLAGDEATRARLRGALLAAAEGQEDAARLALLTELAEDTAPLLMERVALLERLGRRSEAFNLVAEALKGGRGAREALLYRLAALAELPTEHEVVFGLALGAESEEALKLAAQVATTRLRDPRRARQALMAALERTPSPELARQLAQVLEVSGRLAELAALHRAWPEAFGAIEDQLKLAEIEAERGEVGLAGEVLEALLAREPAHEEARERLMRLRLKARDYAAFEALLWPGEARLSALVEGARALTPCPERAQRVWLAVLSASPGHPEALAELDRLAETRRDLALKTLVLEARVDASPDAGRQVQALLALATHHRERRRDGEAAERALLAALAVDPGQVDALRALVELADGSPAALKAVCPRLEAALEAGSPVLGLLIGALMTRARGADADEALALLTQARALAPEDAAVGRALGDLCFERGDLLGAASLYECSPLGPSGTESEDERAMAHRRRALAYACAGQPERALLHWEKATRSAALKLEGLAAMAALHQQAGRGEAAIRCYEQLSGAVAGPDRGRALAEAARIAQALLGKPERAARLLSAALAAGLPPEEAPTLEGRRPRSTGPLRVQEPALEEPALSEPVLSEPALEIDNSLSEPALIKEADDSLSEPALIKEADDSFSEPALGEEADSLSEPALIKEADDSFSEPALIKEGEPAFEADDSLREPVLSEDVEPALNELARGVDGEDEAELSLVDVEVQEAEASFELLAESAEASFEILAAESIEVPPPPAHRSPPPLPGKVTPPPLPRR